MRSLRAIKSSVLSRYVGRFALSAAVILLVECTASTPPDSRRSRLEERDSAARELVALLDRPPQITMAQKVIAAECMKRKGYRYPLPKLEPRRAPLTMVGRPLSESNARAEGYGFGVGSSSPEQRFLSGLPTHLRRSARRALDPGGPPTARVALGSFEVSASRRGCVAEGRRAVYGSVRNFLRVWYEPQVIYRRLQRFYDNAIHGADVYSAVVAYAECMRAAGFDISDPGEAWQTAYSLFARRGSEHSKREKTMAIADAKCQRSSAVYEAMSGSLARSGRRLLNRHVLRLDGLLEIQHRALVRALGVVRRQGSPSTSQA